MFTSTRKTIPTDARGDVLRAIGGGLAQAAIPTETHISAGRIVQCRGRRFAVEIRELPSLAVVAPPIEDERPVSDQHPYIHREV
jgi:hypothetical protein